jgi:hypothetical protein
MELVFVQTISMELVSNTVALREEKIIYSYELYSAMGRP